VNNLSLSVSKLTQAAFAPFGDVIETRGDFLEINQGTTKRFHDLAKIDVTEDSGRPLFNIFRAIPRPQPIAVKLLERHPLSSQAFYPLDKKPYLVLVAVAADEVDVAAMCAFIAHGQQGVNYHRGVWHHPLLAINEESDFIVIDRGGEGENCDEYYFPEDSNIFIDY
jgi:ureidoglycolate lyase